MINNIPKELRNAAGIYEILNTVNGKRYIGSTKCFQRRIRHHKNYLENGIHHSPSLQNTCYKYGIGVLKASVLAIIERLDNETFQQFADRIILTENEFINQYRSNQKEFGYNIRIVANSNVGVPCSQATIQKLKNLVRSDEFRRKISKATKGEKHPRAKINDSDARHIKIMINNGVSVKKIQEIYPISKGSIHHIKSGHQWKHIIISDQENMSFVPNPVDSINDRNLLTNEIKILKYLWEKDIPNSTIAHYLTVPAARIRQARRIKSYSNISLTDIDRAQLESTIDIDQINDITRKFKYSNRQ